MPCNRQLTDKRAGQRLARKQQVARRAASERIISKLHSKSWPEFSVGAEEEKKTKMKMKRQTKKQTEKTKAAKLADKSHVLLLFALCRQPPERLTGNNDHDRHAIQLERCKHNSPLSFANIPLNKRKGIQFTCQVSCEKTADLAPI